MAKTSFKMGKVSLTEMMRSVGADDIEEFRNEDHIRDTRLNYLNDVIGLPFMKPVKFNASEVRDRSQAWSNYFNDHQDDYCAFRCVPKEGEQVKKIRLRGKTVRETLEWFDEQDIDTDKYYLYVMPHKPQKAWSTIFVVNPHGISGEIIFGEHTQLTQGVYDGDPPMVFHYDFKNWNIQPANDEALNYLKRVVEFIRVEDPATQARIKKEQKVEFTHDFLVGYFETIQDADNNESAYIDFSTALGTKLRDFKPRLRAASSKIGGQTGCQGVAEGRARVVSSPQDDFDEGDILITEMTTPEYVPLMQKAAAIVTDEGGILSHAAIVARELNVPCVVGTKGATAGIEDGSHIRVDANNGTIEVL